MKIGVDAGCLGITDERLKVGVYTVVKNLLIELSKTDKRNHYYLYSFSPIEKSLMKKFGKNMKNILVRPARGWLKITLPIRIAFDSIDIFLALNQSMPLVLPISHYKTIGVFYDIAFEKYPQLYSYAASVKRHKENSRILAKKADKIVAISKNTAKDLEHIYNVLPKKISVVYPGFEKLISSLPYQHPKPYFLFVGSFKKSKNIPVLLEAFIRFLKNTHKDFDLLLVGGDKWLDPEITEAISQIPDTFKTHIQFLGFVDQQTLSSLYKNAYAFVSPSLYEGFGLPFLEAQSAGVPVIASFAGSLPEILNGSALLVNPKNVNHLVKAMIEITKNKIMYKKMVENGRKNVRQYTWKLFAKKIQSLTESMV